MADKTDVIKIAELETQRQEALRWFEDCCWNFWYVVNGGDDGYVEAQFVEEAIHDLRAVLYKLEQARDEAAQ